MHQLGFIGWVKPAIQRFKPTGGHILRQPGDIDQKGIKRRRSAQKAADGKVRDGLSFQGAPDHLEIDASTVLDVELLHQFSRGIGMGCWHQDRHLLRFGLTSPDATQHQQNNQADTDQPSTDRHQEIAAACGNPANCSSAQSLTV